MSAVAAECKALRGVMALRVWPGAGTQLHEELFLSRTADRSRPVAIAWRRATIQWPFVFNEVLLPH